MAADVAAQAALFLEGAAVGAALGLLYDLFRVLRERWRHWAGMVLDLLFWLTAAAALFAFAILRGDGEIRLYHGAAFAAGGGGYFLLFSRFVLWLLRRLADGAAFLYGLFRKAFEKVLFLLI